MSENRTEKGHTITKTCFTQTNIYLTMYENKNFAKMPLKYNTEQTNIYLTMQITGSPQKHDIYRYYILFKTLYKSSWQIT